MRLLHKTHRPARAGFTLVELMVALALSVFIMAILSEAFVKGLEVFSQYKALADLENRLRTAANLLRRDLQAPHFEGSRRLSECTVTGKAMPRLDGLRAGPYNVVDAASLHAQLAQYRLASPKQGFFSVEEWPNRPAGVTPGSPEFRLMFFEGTDAAGRPSYLDQYDVLHFTSRLDGNGPDKFFYGRTLAVGGNASPLDGVGQSGGRTRYDIPANQIYSSQAAELLYFVDDDETANMPGAGSPGGPVRTFNLYRQSWLLIPDQYTDGTRLLADNRYGGNELAFLRDNAISAVPFTPQGSPNPVMVFNTIADVQHRARRRLRGAEPPTGSRLVSEKRMPRSFVDGSGNVQREGSDILLTNVVSFDVKVWDPFAYKNPLNPASGRGAFVDIGDTWNMPTSPTSSEQNPQPTAAGLPADALQPNFGGPVDNFAVPGLFDTGTDRIEGQPGSTSLGPLDSRRTHTYPFSSIQITIRVFEFKSKQTRQITIIQDM